MKIIVSNKRLKEEFKKIHIPEDSLLEIDADLISYIANTIVSNIYIEKEGVLSTINANILEEILRKDIEKRVKNNLLKCRDMIIREYSKKFAGKTIKYPIDEVLSIKSMKYISLEDLVDIKYEIHENSRGSHSKTAETAETDFISEESEPEYIEEEVPAIIRDVCSKIRTCANKYEVEEFLKYCYNHMYGWAQDDIFDVKDLFEGVDIQEEAKKVLYTVDELYSKIEGNKLLVDYGIDLMANNNDWATELLKKEVEELSEDEKSSRELFISIYKHRASIQRQKKISFLFSLHREELVKIWQKAGNLFTLPDNGEKYIEDESKVYRDRINEITQSIESESSGNTVRKFLIDSGKDRQQREKIDERDILEDKEYLNSQILEQFTFFYRYLSKKQKEYVISSVGEVPSLPWIRNRVLVNIGLLVVLVLFIGLSAAKLYGKNELLKKLFLN